MNMEVSKKSYVQKAVEKNLIPTVGNVAASSVGLYIDLHKEYPVLQSSKNNFYIADSKHESYTQIFYNLDEKVDRKLNSACKTLLITRALKLL